VRRLAWWRLDLRFPAERGEILPTRLGNTIRAFELYSRTRWGLSSIVAWPRIEALLSEDERQLNADSESEFAFFLNSAVGALLVAIVLGLDGVVNHPHSLWLVWMYILPLPLSYLLYRASVGAAERWGMRVRSSIDLHRLDLYEQLGLRSPSSFEEERALAAAVNQCLYWGTPIPEHFKAPVVGPPHTEA
jgi:hypothetical protein